MKKKLLGIFVCMLLIVIMAIPISALNKVYVTVPEPISKDADVPVWVEGDSWTYEIEILENSDENATRVSTMSGDVTWTVTDDSGDSYTLEGTTESFASTYTMGLLGFKSTRFFNVSGELRVRKTDLGLEHYKYHGKGIILPTIFGIPLPIPIQTISWKNSEFNPTWVITPFPLYDGKNGTLDNTHLYESWSFTLFWGLIPITEGNSDWDTGELDYTCFEEQVTVPAGPYDVYNLSAEGYGDHYRTYYAPEVGNSAKQSISISFGPDDPSPLYYSLEMELKSTNYTP